MKFKTLLATLLLASLSWSQQQFEILDSPGRYAEERFSPIQIKVNDFYGMEPDKNGDYHMHLNGKRQTLVKLEGTIPQKNGYHRVTWKTDKTYLWSNGMVTDEFKVVNSEIGRASCRERV